jgi:prepilin-type N-terminal cleavage/methylation domain-containing protein
MSGDEKTILAMKEARGSRVSISRVRKASGFSLPEIITVIAIIGVLASAAVVAIPRILGSSKSAVARNVVETMNSGLHRFNQSNYELIVAEVSASANDELAVLRTLQYRDPTLPVTGSPYVRNDWNPATSSSASDYRIIWAGTIFKLMEPGAAGTGLKVKFDGSDLGTPYAFPVGYTMAGH